MSSASFPPSLPPPTADSLSLAFLNGNIKPEAEWKTDLGLLLVSLSVSLSTNHCFSLFSSAFLFSLHLWQVPTVSFSHDLRLKGNYPVRLEEPESIHAHTLMDWLYRSPGNTRVLLNSYYFLRLMDNCIDINAACVCAYVRAGEKLLNDFNGVVKSE